MMWYYGWDSWTWLWMAGMMVLIWGGVAFLAAWVLRGISGSEHSDDAAMVVFRRRLAGGEISPEEFEKTKKALGV